MENTTQQEKRVFLYNDTATYKMYLDRQTELFKVFDKYKDIIYSTIGEDANINPKALGNDPVTHITELFFKTFGYKIAPANANKVTVFENATKLSISRINNIKQKYDSIYASLGKYAPKPYVNDFEIKLKESQFDRFLDPEKADHYRILKKFLSYAKQLELYGSDMPIHLLRYGNQVEMNNSGEVVIDLNYFKC